MANGSVWSKLQPMRKRKMPMSELKAGSMIEIRPQNSKPIDIKRDAGRKAKLPGWKISKTGKRYYEGRANRTDLPGKRI